MGHCPQTLEAASVNILAPDLKLTGEAWTAYSMGDSPEGGYMGWLHEGVVSVIGQVALPEPLAPGEYRVFLKGINYAERVSVQVSCGGGTSEAIVPLNGDWNGYWTEGIPVTAATPADVLDLRLGRTGAAGDTVKYLIRGVYVTDDADAVVDRYDTVVRTARSASMDRSDPIKGNRLPNGGFEVGIGHGWGGVSVGQTRDYSTMDLWDRTQAYEGECSARVPAGKRLVSRVIRVRPDRRHTMSLWARSPDEGAVLRVALGNVHRGIEGLEAVTEIRKDFTVGLEWARVSMSGDLMGHPAPEYQLRLSTQDSDVWVDALQLEEGELSPYAPMAPIELGLVSDKPANIMFEDEGVEMGLLAHNGTTEAISCTVEWNVFDHLNRRTAEGRVALTAPAKATVRRQLDLSSGRRGAFRAVVWVAGMAGSDEEMVFSVVPRPQVDGPDESSMIGIHANVSDFQYEALTRLGIKWLRIMSTTQWFRWGSIEPEEGKFIWHDDEAEKTARHGFHMLGTLSTNWPKWADRDGMPDLDEWENSVHQIAHHYRPWGTYWEIWNEPIYTFTPEFYAQMLTRAKRAITKANPQAKIVGMGGSYKPEWCIEVLEALGGKATDHMDYLSTHLYPLESDPMNPSSGLAAKAFRDRVMGPYGIEVWNTEAGAWCLGFYQGVNSSFRAPGKTLWPHQDAVRYYRGCAYEAERVACNFLHSTGNGFGKYFYYDSRFHASPDYYKTRPTIIAFDDTIRPKGVAYAILAHLFDHSKGLANVSPAEGTFAYLFDRDGTPLVALWAGDAKNQRITLELDRREFTAYDMMGNRMAGEGRGLRFGREPVYLKGREGLSVAETRRAIEGATIDDVSDVTPPSVSISDVPRGSTNGQGLRFRWIGIDDTSVPSNTCPEAITYSYRLAERDGWSGWTARTHADYEALEPGDYTFEVRARDAAGNISGVARREFEVRGA